MILSTLPEQLAELAGMHTDVAVVGGGSAGLALAYHCITDEAGVPVTILEERPKYENDRTWCFWDFAEITGELQGLIRHRWHRWLFSGGGEHVIHHSHAHPYCAIAAGDFYQMVRQRILASDSVHLVTGCRVDAITRYENGGFVIQTERGTLRCRRVIDTRPPYPEYLVGMTDATARQIPEKLAGTPIFQVFLGYEVETERPCFDPTTAWLMTDMKSDGDGLRFVYMLPYTKTSALIEYTLFSTKFMVPVQLHDACAQAVSELCGTGGYTVVRREGAVLPMGLLLKPGHGNHWLQAGIGGGALRASTGYAFIRTQRWAAACAAALGAGRPALPHHEDGRIMHYLDQLFLDVLSVKPGRARQMFMGMAQNLPADCFARFMMEQSTWRDYPRVIRAMPAQPFITRFLARLVGR
jgi:lycopene beta-cyclase